MAREKAAGSKAAKTKTVVTAQTGNQQSDEEARKSRLTTLIKLGKERGFLTYAEVNDHLPDDVVDAEQIESIISTFNDMGIQVYDEAPDAETLLMSENAPTVAAVAKNVYAGTITSSPAPIPNARYAATSADVHEFTPRQYFTPTKSAMACSAAATRLGRGL